MEGLRAEGGVVEELAGGGGTLDHLLTGDNESDGSQNEGLIDNLLAEGGTVDEILGDGGTVDDILTGDNDPDGTDTEGAIAHRLGGGGVVDELFGNKDDDDLDGCGCGNDGHEDGLNWLF